ncbi:MAG: DUF5367 family protein [Hyphomonadaceae bacterium]|nr:DUF5367 family protein [Hyphomonadaceae bacterium]
MILRAMALGFVLWLALTAALRFAGEYFFTPQWAPTIVAYLITVVAAALVTYLLLKLLREAHGDEAEAAICIAFPGLVFNAFLTHQFGAMFPALDPTLDGVFAAHALVGAAAIVFTGLFFTRLAPQDERL